MLRAREALHPERFTFQSSRMRMHKVTPEELTNMNREGLRCAAELSDARVDVMSTACLVAIMAQGLGYHRQVERNFKQVCVDNGSDAKVITSAGALIHGLTKLGAKKVSLMAPYMKPLTDKVVEYIESKGIEVVDRICFEIPDNLEVGGREPMRLLDDVKKLNTANVDVAVLSAFAQMQSLPVLQLAQDALGIPVTSTSDCTVRNMLNLLGLTAAMPGFGKVLTV